MRFAEPMLLWLLALVPVLVGLLIWRQRTLEARLSQVGDLARIARMSHDKHPLLPAVRWVMLFFGLTLLIVAAARPQFGTSSKLMRREGIDIAVAIDVSQSMNARDIRPDRLRRAKLELMDLLERLQGDRVGLVVFAGDAFVQCPLTVDYGALRLFLDAIEVGMVARGGTHLEGAITESARMLAAAQRGAPRGKVIIVITDGEEQDGNAMGAAEKAAKAGAVVYTVGVGSSTGEPIPVVGPDGVARGYLKDGKGQTVMSRLDEALLRQIADAGKGRFIHSAGGGAGIVEVHRELARLQRSEFESRLFVQFDEKYHWVLWPALVFIAIATLLGEKRRFPLDPEAPPERLEEVHA